MKLHRRNDKTYYARIRPSGRKGGRVQFTIGRVTREEAVGIYRKKAAELAARYGKNDRVTFSTLAALYLEAEDRGQSERAAVERFGKAFGERRAMDLRAADWRTYSRARQKTDEVSSATLKREFSVFRAILNHAAAEEVVDRNPIARGAIKFEKDVNRLVYFTPEEWRALYSAFDDEARFRAHVQAVRRFGPKSGGGRRPDSEATGVYLASLRETMPVLRALLLTGSRLGEIVGLTWQDVDLAAGVVRIPQPKVDTAKQIPIGADLRALLLSLPKGVGAANVFRHRDGSPIATKTVQRAFALAKRFAGIRAELTPHSLRHTAASWMVMQGVPLFTVARALGHSDVRMTAKYAHLAPEHLRDAVEAVAAMEKSEKGSKRATMWPLRQSDAQ